MYHLNTDEVMQQERENVPQKNKSFKLFLLLENKNRQIYSDVYAIMLTIKCDHVSPSQNDDMNKKK